ncbi:MAG: carbohydrate kinase [Bacteroidaceae bacterium]|nr:carbohydrate kinase [Bacteroidaceae bacterium]
MENKRKVVGVGETVLDILFRDGQPKAAVHGGSSFNSIISVGRAGVPCTFVGYTGADIVGRQTVDFLRANGVGTEHFQVRQGEKSCISLAFLADNGDASYIFYKEPPHVDGAWTLPEMERGDVLLFGSYYAACTGMRPLIEQIQSRAAEANAIVYYDLNFRRSHQDELEALLPAILQNFSRSTIVRGSADDFEIMFASRDARVIYNRYISQHCPYFICTAGAGEIIVCTPAGCHDFQAPPIHDVVSTVGAGDSFNAGFACALIWEGIMPEDFPNLDKEAWQRLVATACRFAGETCRSTENYIKPHTP